MLATGSRELIQAYQRQTGESIKVAFQELAHNNPYYSEKLAGLDSLTGYEKQFTEEMLLTGLREGFVKTFTWAMPNYKAISEIAKYSPLIEIGAGTGYWAMLLEDAGADILAFDLHPPRPRNANYYHKPFTYTRVQRGGASTVAKHPKRTLFLCWPPYTDPMAYQCLLHYQGNTLVYIGEGYGGCNGNDDFHEALNTNWTQVDDIGIPQWPGIHDSLSIWNRRG